MQSRLVIGAGVSLVALLALGAALSNCASVRTDVRRPPDDPADALTDDLPADRPATAFVDGRVHDERCGAEGAWEQNRSAAVLRLDIPLLRGDLEPHLLALHASYADAAAAHRGPERVLPSVNAIDGKAKQFDDGLVAALALARFGGLPAADLEGRVAIVRRMRAAVGDGSAAAPFLGAALRLADPETAAPESPAEREYLRRFLASPTLSRPFAFYTWTDELGRLFRFSRFLQQEFPSGSLPGESDLRAALAADAALRTDYERSLALDAGIHNPPACASLLTPARPGAPTAVLPPASSREIELFARLFPRGVPSGANLMEELVRRVRSGEVDLAPRPGSGWIDRQVHALETLLLPDRAAEAPKLLLTKAYKKRMLEAFQALLTKRIETHGMEIGARAESAAPVPKTLEPTLRVEPCATYALRTARAYAFLEGFLVAALGEDALAGLRGLREGGVRDADLLTELREVRDLFYGIHLVSCDDLGASDAIAGDEPVDRAACRAAAVTWLGRALLDPDLAEDTRVAVPVHVGVGGSRVWATLGVRLTRLEVSWARRAHIRPADGSGPWQEAPWGSVTYMIPVEEFAELRLAPGRTLTREDLRDAAGRGRTRQEVLERLE